MYVYHTINIVCSLISMAWKAKLKLIEERDFANRSAMHIAGRRPLPASLGEGHNNNCSN